jgi:hypothetical protein
MPAIFVSYRRGDSASAAGRMCDRLNARFGAERVFRDIDSIEAGDDFDRAIRDALRAALVVIVVIGPRWIDGRDDRGRRRLDDPRDYVRREIEIALATDATLLPVLVDGAAPPTPEELPEPLRPLARRQASELSDRRWNDDILALNDRIAAVLGDDAALVSDARANAPPKPSPASASRAVLEAGAGYPMDAVSLIRAPRRFLRRRSGADPKHLLAAFVFFVISVLVSDATLTGIYRPQDSVPVFLFSGLTVAVVGTVGMSAPLWIVWRAVGVRRHYPALLVILLYQSGVAHLLIIVAGVLGFIVVESRSLNIVTVAMTHALEAGGSLEAALVTAGETLAAAVDGRTLRLATTICLIGAIAATVFLVRSWGAYRDAFDVSRTRSGLAGLLLFAMAGLVSFLAVRLG